MEVAKDVITLSKKMFQEVLGEHWEAGPQWEGAHPAVMELLEQHGPLAASAALVYIERGNRGSGATAVHTVRWMLAGGYLGDFTDMAEFAERQFAGEFQRWFDKWGQREQLGFPNMEISDVSPIWESVGYAVEHEDRFPAHFAFLASVNPSGSPVVYAFDNFARLTGL